MNMFKKTGGFTLVELIVVIAILAILAGVAVPAYSGYINKAKEAGDLTTLNAIQTAVNAAFADETDFPVAIQFTEPSTIAIKTDATATDFTALTDDQMDEVEEFFGRAINEQLDSTDEAVVWTNAEGWDIG